MKCYTGVGSRNTPAAVLETMDSIAKVLHEREYHLRTGGAVGADTAFEHAVPRDAVSVFRPNGEGVDGLPSRIRRYPLSFWNYAREVAEKHHPKFRKLTPYVQDLHTRNVFQVLGPKLDDPSLFMVCWTPDGAEKPEETSRDTGGTGTTIRIAGEWKVPVYNLAREDCMTRLSYEVFTILRGAL